MFREKIRVARAKLRQLTRCSKCDGWTSKNYIPCRHCGGQSHRDSQGNIRRWQGYDK